MVSSKACKTFCIHKSNAPKAEFVELVNLPINIEISSNPDDQWLTLHITENSQIITRFEVETKAQASISLQVDRRDDVFMLRAEDRRLLTFQGSGKLLQNDNENLSESTQKEHLQLALLIDATCVYSQTQGSDLSSLQPIEEIKKLELSISEYLKTIDASFAVLTYSDSNVDERFDHSFFNTSNIIDWMSPGGRFVPFKADHFSQAVAKIVPKPGFDFVDELATGLVACEDLPWRDDARRVLIVCGDSPGYSIVNPPPKSDKAVADIGPRYHDVESTLERLKSRGIEIVSLYLGNRKDYELDDLNRLSEWAEDQYRYVASCPQFALTPHSLNEISFESLMGEKHEVSEHYFHRLMVNT